MYNTTGVLGLISSHADTAVSKPPAINTKKVAKIKIIFEQLAMSTNKT